MGKSINIGIYFLIFGCILFSCGKANEKQNGGTHKTSPESLVNVNKYLVQKDKEAIENYIKRHKWEMEFVESGLWYMIYEEGSGPNAEIGDVAIINYEISLLEGTVCYTSDSLHPKTFKIGQGGIESGLEQGILLMKQGDKAKFILPPHLAHGLLGDEKKTPPRAVIVYDVELKKIIH